MDDLFDPDKAYHRTDPETSAEAADGAQRFAGGHYQIILDVLEKSTYGLTSREISNSCELDYLQVVRRLSELNRTAAIVNTGECRLNPNGCRATVWSLRRRRQPSFAW